MPTPPPVYHPPVKCTCPKVAHHHGTYLMFQKDRCRCQPCTDAMWRKNKEAVIRKQRGRGTTSVPATRAQDHIRALKESGMPLESIARAARVGRVTVVNIHTGEAERIYATTERKILAVPAPVVPMWDIHRVHVAGTRRRIRALITLGHTTEDIAHATRLDPHNLSRISSPGSVREWVDLDVEAKVRAAYDRLWDKVPDESTRARKSAVKAARTRAIRNGWLPPLAWDDDRIDDPTYQPNITVLGGQRSAHDRLDDLDHLLNAGVPAEEAAPRVGYSNPDNAYDSAKRIGRTATMALLSPERNVA